MSRVVAQPVPRDESIAAALKAHEILHDETWQIDERSPMPDRLLQACRLHVMTAAEAFLHDLPLPDARNKDVAVMSASNEQRALLKARELLSGLPSSEAAIDVALGENCRLSNGHNVEADDSSSFDALRTDVLASVGAPDGGAARLACCAYGGRGLVSARSLAAGESVVSVPSSALLSVAAARRCATLGPLLHLIDEGEWTEHVIVILLLLHERRKGAASHWAKWFAALPTEWNNLCSWSEGETALLAGTAAYWRAYATREELTQMRDEILPRLRLAAAELRQRAGCSIASDDDTGTFASSDAFAFPDEHYSLEQWVWARSVIETRALALPIDLGDMRAGDLVLAPAIDFANHSEAAEMQLHVDAARGLFSLRTVCAVPAGVQLCLSYGALDAEQLLEHHGIVDATPPPPAASLSPPPAATLSPAASQPPVTSAPTRRVADRRVGAPLVVPISLSPCECLEEDESLLSSVLLIMQHIGLSLECMLPELPLSEEESRQPTWARAQGGADGGANGGAGGAAGGEAETAAEETTAPRVDVVNGSEAATSPPAQALTGVLPARLLGCARLCSLIHTDQLTELPVALADRSPLSEANEQAAIAMLRAKFEEVLQAERTALGDSAVEATDGSKRQRRAGADRGWRLSQERRSLARRLGLRRQRVLAMALESLDVIDVPRPGGDVFDS